MKMDTKKIMATFAILMMALGVAGYAYAHWTKIITINGTITTGTLELEPSFSVVGIAGTKGWLPEKEGKHVSYINWTIKDNTLTVSINNTHPCLWVNGTFDLKNTGTVPAGLHNWTFTIYGETYTIYPGVITPSMNEDAVEAALKSFVETAATGPAGTAVRISIDFAGSNFWQIDPGENPTVTFNLHFEEALLQDQTFTFTMKLAYYNWNEA